MKTIHLTRENTIRAVSEIVAEAGNDFVYEQIPAADGLPGCRYVHNGKSSCLIGRVLHEKFGIPLTAFREDMTASELLGVLKSHGHHHDFELTWEPGVPGYLDAVQRVQDDKGPYKFASLAGEIFWRGWTASGKV